MGRQKRLIPLPYPAGHAIVKAWKENGRDGKEKEKRKSLEEGEDLKGGRVKVFREGWVRLQRGFARNVDVGGRQRARKRRREDMEG